MLETLLQADRDLFLYLNSKHSDGLDLAMYLISRTATWTPLYLGITGFIWLKLKKRSFILLIGIAILITLADRISSGIFKPSFARPRPCHEEALKGQVFIYDGKCGGRFGFVSSHAANSFAVAFLLIMVYSRQHKWTWLLLIWAFVVSYSRIYLGVHYPGDIIGGALLGILLSVIVYMFYNRIKDSQFLNQPRKQKIGSSETGYN
jgi:undecaprenyl-diphosphatase